MNEKEYAEKKRRIECLTAVDPYPDTIFGQELERLVFEIAAYEKVILKQVAVAAGINKVFPDKDGNVFVNFDELMK